MPASKRPKPLYQRGDFKLYRREGRANLEIVWYDAAKRRERSTSAGTGDDDEAKAELDRRYLKEGGRQFCPSCKRPMDDEASPFLTQAISDYLLRDEEKAGFRSTRSRLRHAIDYVATTNRMTVTCAQIDQEWVDDYRAWLAAKPVVTPKSGETWQRSLGAIEGCVLQLAACINATPGQKAQFKNEQLKAVAVSPEYRATVPVLAAMFRFAMADKQRASLLRYLRAAVATWARPEEIFDLCEGQWNASAGVLNLNPKGRRQTKKHRTTVPIPRQFAPYLDEMTGSYMEVMSVRATWAKMRAAIKLPTARAEAGEKLIRRSMATIARKRIGEANWVQGKMMLGHVKHDISDIYALPDPHNLGLALAATEAIIDEIETLAPGAFQRAAGLRLVAL